MGHRRIVVVACVVLAALLAPAATARPSSPSVPFRATLTATVTGGTAWCCGRTLQFAGSGAVQGVGAVDVTGSWLGGCSFPSLPTPCFRRLSLVLVTPSGDALSIAGDDEWTLPFDTPPQVTSWATDASGSSGRLGQFAASGTYTLEDLSGGSAVTISLSGSRQRGAA